MGRAFEGAAMMGSRDRKISLSGNWPVADPEPSIVALLKEIHGFLGRGDIAADHRDEKMALRQKMQKVLDPWRENEDIDELRLLLGVKQTKGRRRTQRTVNREYGVAFATYELMERGKTAASAVRQIAVEASVDEKTVRRCMDKWANAQAVVKVAHQLHPGRAILDYSDLLNTKDKK